jgi:hypothetical protein
MSARIDDLVAELRDPCRALIAACDDAGLQPRLTSTLRSHAEQKRLYNRFLAGQSGYPVAPPGSSAHEYGEAFDMVVSPMEALADVGYTWQTWGGGWGPGDAVHFELPGATARAKATIQAAVNDLPWYESLAAGLPITFWPSIVFDLLGIPSEARKDINPAQAETLRKIALSVR